MHFKKNHFEYDGSKTSQKMGQGNVYYYAPSPLFLLTTSSNHSNFPSFLSPF